MQEPARAGAVDEVESVGRVAAHGRDVHAGVAVEGGAQPVGGLPAGEEAAVTVVGGAVEEELDVKWRWGAHDAAEAEERGVVALEEGAHVVHGDEGDILLKRLQQHVDEVDVPGVVSVGVEARQPEHSQLSVRERDSTYGRERLHEHELRPQKVERLHEVVDVVLGEGLRDV